MHVHELMYAKIKKNRLSTATVDGSDGPRSVGKSRFHCEYIMITYIPASVESNQEYFILIVYFRNSSELKRIIAENEISVMADEWQPSPMKTTTRDKQQQQSEPLQNTSQILLNGTNASAAATTSTSNANQAKSSTPVSERMVKSMVTKVHKQSEPNSTPLHQRTITSPIMIE